ncbi:MAG: glycerate kinase type-2 family protein [Bacillota bacterium]
MKEKNHVIKNKSQLLKGKFIHMRSDAISIIESGILKAIPTEAIFEIMKLEGNKLRIKDNIFDLSQIENIYVIGAGKATIPIMEAIDGILGDKITKGFAAVKEEHPRKLAHIDLFTSSHPNPDERSVLAAERIERILMGAKENDLILAAITGGASSLVVLPPEGISLTEIQELNDALLKSGGTIAEMNIVRRHLCKLKGGNMVRISQPAHIVTFSLNTGTQGLPWPDMCLTDPTTFEDAIDVLKRYDLWNTAPEGIKNHFTKGVLSKENETVKSFDTMKQTMIYIADPSEACKKMADRAEELGYSPHILAVSMDGEAKDVGIVLGSIANEIVKNNSPFIPPCALITGGETTVTFCGKGPFGEGGPNQETVLGFALQLEKDFPAVCISVDSDGTDGPTAIAGGISDGETKQRIEQEGISLKECLRKHDASSILLKLKDEVITGHTGTNIMNLRVVLINKKMGWKDGQN